MNKNSFTVTNALISSWQYSLGTPKPHDPFPERTIRREGTLLFSLSPKDKRQESNDQVPERDIPDSPPEVPKPDPIEEPDGGGKEHKKPIIMQAASDNKAVPMFIFPNDYNL